MKGSPAVQAAARRILFGDQSTAAAKALESAILQDHGDDGDLDDLVYALASYSPGEGRDHYGVDELRAEIIESLDVIDPSSYER